MTPWRELPPALAPLRELALDIRWTWSHEGVALWSRIDAEVWRRTRNPWSILAGVSSTRLGELAADPVFVDYLSGLVAARRALLEQPAWFNAAGHDARLKGVAFFSMEYGFGDAMPIYAGGLGVLAADLLKAASDLGVPVIGVGLLYQEGYFRQMLDASGWQHEVYPYNDPSAMPIEPVAEAQGGLLHVPVEMPGRTVLLRVWRVTVGRTLLYLLDSNDTLNGPVDRGITGTLYGGGNEMRLMQEIVLGIGGWRLMQVLHPEIEVCHLNEGHAAFAVIERARQIAERDKLGFAEALWMTRAGNVFTTHTPVDAGFDRFTPALLTKYIPEAHEILALGRAEQSDRGGLVNMAFLAAHGSLLSFGVSRLHGVVSRQIFQPLYPRWPEGEVPVAHVTNGVHVPTWVSEDADAMWKEARGGGGWRRVPEDVQPDVEKISDTTLWTLRGRARERLVRRMRRRLVVHLASRGVPAESVLAGVGVLDANVLTLGFARRFTGYKRTDLLLHDRDRLLRLLSSEARPMQLVIAGKAHPADAVGKHMIQAWISIARLPAFRRHVVFLEDYDVSLAQELVRGVDVWINTPRRPWEACGTSGMKVLVNGGLNLSTLDGWWEEAFAPDLGWAIGDGKFASASEQDAHDAEELYALLEHEVAPAFYDRDEAGVPRRWLAYMRRSMAVLTPQFSATRMVRDYVEQAYLPAAAAARERARNGARQAKAMARWDRRVHAGWTGVRIGAPALARDGDAWTAVVPVYLGEIGPDDVRVELYADASIAFPADAIVLARDAVIAGAAHGYRYVGRVETGRPPTDYTARVVPHFAGARIPAECPLIRWQK